MTSRDQHIRSGAFFLAGKLISPILAFGSVMIYTRWLSQEDYGGFALMGITLNFMTLLGQSWLVTAMLRFGWGSHLLRERQVFFSTFGILAGVSLLTVGLLGGAGLWLWKGFGHGNAPLLFILLIANYFLMGFIEVLLTMSRIDQKAKDYLVFYSSSVAVRTLAGALALFVVPRVESILFGWFVANLGFMLWFQRDRVRFPRIERKFFSTGLCREIIQYGWPFIFSSFSALALDQIDRYVVMSFRGAKEVAVYNIGYLLAGQGLGMLTFLNDSTYSALVSTWEVHGRESAVRLLSKVARMLLLLGVPCTVGLSVLSREVLMAFLPASYWEAYRIIPWVSAGVMLSLLLQFSQKSSVLLKKSQWFAGVYVLGAVLNLTLNLLLVPRFGYFAAAWVTVASYGALFLSYEWINRRVLLLSWDFPWRSAGSIVISSAVMGSLVYFLRTVSLTPSAIVNLLCLIAVGAAAYLLCLFLLGEVQEGDRRILTGVLGKVLPFMRKKAEVPG